jgi:hypothetical protein
MSDLDRWPAKPQAAENVRLIHILLLIGILIGATLLRVHLLGKNSYWYDEICSVLYARGQTEAIFKTPQGYFEHAPAIASPPGMRPWRNVWSGFDTTPPLYPSLLRMWWSVFGDGEISGRALSVALSVLAIAALFDLGRLILTPSLALWACALCAASPPMIRYAQEARAYSLACLLAVLACDVAVRIARLGGSARRYLLLWLCCGATLLTHHFLAGGIAAIGLFSIIKLRGRTRWITVGAIAAACIVELWAVPILLAHGKSTRAGIDWLVEPRTGLLAKTIFRIAWLPLDFLIHPPDNVNAACVPAIVLLILPLFLHRQRPGVLLAGLWPLGIIGLVAASDLWLGHGALAYDRYTLAAGPLVCVGFVAIADAGGRWARHALPALALGGALLAVPQAYTDETWLKPETRALAQDVNAHLKPSDCLVVESQYAMGLYAAAVTYLNIDYYDGPLPCAVAILEDPADYATRQAIWSHKRVFLIRAFDGLGGTLTTDPTGYMGRCRLTPMGDQHFHAGRLYLAERIH